MSSAKKLMLLCICATFLYSCVYWRKDSKIKVSIVDVFRGTCGSSAYSLGDHQKVISYTVYGNHTLFFKGLNEILNAAQELYPGWQVRIYTDNAASSLLKDLKRMHSHLHICDAYRLPPPYNTLKDHPFRIWRFLPIIDPQVDYLLSRDADSQLLPREMDAVSEWLRSNKSLHVMRDHPWHGLIVLAGTWGAKITPQNRNLWNQLMKKLFQKSLKSRVTKQLDQDLLREFVWPKFRKDSMVHDSYTCKRFPNSKPFPTQRVNGSYIGAPYYIRYRNKIDNECPKECRPKNHMDWKLC